MDYSLGQRIKKSIFWNTILPIGYQIIKSIFSIYIARLLEPRDFGIMGIASIIVFSANNLTNFGLSNALVQRTKINATHYQSVFVFNILLSMLLVVVTIAMAKPVATYFEIPALEPVLIVLSAIYIVTSFYLIPSTVLRRDVQFKRLSITEATLALSQSAITLALAVLGYGYWALVFGLLSGQLIGTLMINYYALWVPKLSFHRQAFKDLLNFSIWNFFMGQVELIINYIDKFIIGKALGPTLLGFYDKAFAFALMPYESISKRIGGVMFASFSRSQHETESLIHYFEKSMTVIALICFPLFFGLAVVAPSFVLVLLGEKWAPMQLPMQVLCFAFLVNSMTGLVMNLSVAIGRYRMQGVIQIICAGILITGCVSLVDQGIAAVSLLILATQIFWFYLAFRHVSRTLRFSWNNVLRAIWQPTLNSILMAVSVWFSSIFLFKSMTLVNLSINITWGAITYSLLFFLIPSEATHFIRLEIIQICGRGKNYLYRCVH